MPDRTATRKRPFLTKTWPVFLSTAIEQLPPLYRTLIALYHQQELSYEEIAQITSLPDGTVKNYLFRARKLLKQHLLARYQRDEL